MKKQIIKNGDIINGQQLVEIIKNHGDALVSVDGSMPAELDAQDLQDLAGMEGFAAIMNYGNGVRFYWEGEGQRVSVVVGGLKGKCDNLVENGIKQPAQWFAEA